MCKVGDPCKTGWKEKLPDTCPPVTAVSTSGEELYTLVSPEGPVEADFNAAARLDPARHILPDEECTAKALSVWTSLTQIRKRVLALPRHHGKKVVLVRLPEDAGALGPESRYGHRSWWRCGKFDPVPKSTLVA